MLLNIILGVLFVAVMTLVWILLGMKKKLEQGSEKKEEMERMVAMQETLRHIMEENRELRREIDSKLSQTHKVSQQQMADMSRTVQGITGESTRLIREITQELSSVKETGRQVISFTDQLKNLQDILQNPKQRGILGEYYLETVLKNVLSPEQFQMQYKFENGDIVDAVVFLDKKKILPVDSKFSLENYNKMVQTSDPQEKERLGRIFKNDLKMRIDETSKYIKPKEGTMDFAFMFIPSEGIYYDLLVGSVGSVDSLSLIEYAFQQKKVIIVSPTSFLAYLQTVLQGLRSLKIEEKAQDIIKRVGQLDKHINVFGQFMNKLGNSLSTTVNHFNNSHKEFAKIDKDIFKITGESSGVDVLSIENPQLED